MGAKNKEGSLQIAPLPSPVNHRSGLPACTVATGEVTVVGEVHTPSSRVAAFPSEREAACLRLRNYLLYLQPDGKSGVEK